MLSNHKTEVWDESPLASLKPARDAGSEAAGQITALERTVADLQGRLKDSEIRYRYACELSNQIHWIAAPNGDLLEHTPLWTALTGLSPEDSLGRGWTAAVNPKDLGKLLTLWQQALSTGEPLEADFRMIMHDGKLRWFHARATPRREPDDSITCWYGTVEDNHDRRAAEEAQAESSFFIQSILESMTDLVLVLDQDFRITFMNAAAAEYVRTSRNGKVGDVLWELYEEYRGSEYEQRYHEAVTTGRPIRFESYVTNLEVWLEINACPTGAGLALFIRDITDSRRAIDALYQLAHQDALTGLANRTVFSQVLEEAFAERGRYETSVLLFDLDLFKEVNDTLGHSVGDQLLRAVAQRLRASVRKGDVFARLGGDEFAIVHRPDPSGRSTLALAQNLMSGFSAPFIIDGMAIKLTASIGIAMSSPAHASDNDLFKAADIALYRAKEDGRGAIRTFDALMAERVQARQSIKIDLEVALARGELRLVYQPIMELETGRLAGAEALLRWRHPTRGDVSPAEFIPLAEDTGLIVPIGDWVLEAACREAAFWPRDKTLAVNLSSVQIRDGTLPLRVAGALSKAGIMPEKLELEITESVLLNDSDINISILHNLRSIGVRIALDDFGTGYSSLSYLRHFPFDKLKLDRCFVQDIGSSRPSRAIARAAGEMGRAFSMTTTAEGVETQEQLDWLRANGWTQAQGYHIGRPMESSTIRHLFAVPCRAVA